MILQYPRPAGILWRGPSAGVSHREMSNKETGLPEEDVKVLKPTRRLSEAFTLPEPPPAHSSFEFNVHTDRNFPSRRTMEDAHAFAYDFAGSKDDGYFAIFDGHGGKTASRWAATNFQLVLEKRLKADPEGDVQEILRDTFKEIDGQLTPENGIHSGCTAIMCLLRWEEADGQKQRVLYTANVGDARAVLCRDGKAIRLSHDHKASDPLEQKRIRDAGGFVHNERVNGILAVARSLGDHELKEYIIGTPFTSRIILNTVGQDPQDTVIILACDGVWDTMDDQQVCDLANAHQDPREAAKLICDGAITAGSSDNISVIVVYLQRRSEESASSS